MLKLLIFDWDDTITIGGLDLYSSCYQDALKELGVSTDYQELRSIVFDLWGRPHRVVIGALLEHFDHSDQLLDQAAELYNQRITTDYYLDKISLVPGAIEALTLLSQHYTLAIASSGNPHVIKEKLIPRLHIPPLFSQILTARELPDVTRGKPYPDLALAVLKYHNLLPEEALVIGDSQADWKMAVAAGIDFVAVLTGQLTEEKAIELKIENILNSIADLAVFLGVENA